MADDRPIEPPDLAAELERLLADSHLKTGSAGAAMNADVVERLAVAMLDDAHPEILLRCEDLLRDRSLHRSVMSRVKKRAEVLEAAAQRRQHADARASAPTIGSAVASLHEGNVRPPTFANHVVPHPYVVAPSGVTERPRPEAASVMVTPTVVAISGRGQEPEAGSYYLDLSWLDERGRWRTITAPREQALVAQSLRELSGRGFPVNSNTAAELVSYLSAYEVENAVRIAETAVLRRPGWYGTKGRPWFATGSGTAIGPHAPPRVTYAPEAKIDPPVRRTGTLDGWIEIVRPVAEELPVIRLLLLASLAGPLLLPLDAENALVGLAGETSSGKTSACRFARSVVGSPRDRLASWSGTGLGRELLAMTHCDGPYYLDDTAAARQRNGKSEVLPTIYRLIAGIEDARGKRNGELKERRHWRVVAIITSEAPVSDAGHAGGAAARIFSIGAPPWDDVSEDRKRQIDAVLGRLEEHHGHALPVLVEWLLESPAHIAEVRAEYDRLRASLGGAGAQGRVADAAALLGAAGLAGARAGVLPWQQPLDQDPRIMDLVTAAGEQVQQGADLPAKAWESTMSWLRRQPGRIFGGNEPPVEACNGPRVAPHGGWLGRERDRWIDVYPDALLDYLKRQGFAAEATLSAWRDRRLLDPGAAYDTKDGHQRSTRRRVRIAGVRTPMISLRWDDDFEDPRGKRIEEAGDAETAAS